MQSAEIERLILTGVLFVGGNVWNEFKSRKDQWPWRLLGYAAIVASGAVFPISILKH